MRITVLGSGYVGLSISVGFADKDNFVTCVDIDEEKVKNINKGKPPIYEEKLDELLNQSLEKGLLRATTKVDDFGKESSLFFVTIGTPSTEDGRINLSMIKKGVGDLAKILEEKRDYFVIVVKSTVVPGTTRGDIIPIMERESGKKVGKDFGVCMNPEFLREGKAISDFLNPDRIVIGEYDKSSGDMVEKLYSRFDAPILRMSLESSEMVKYASNSFLASKISFINEIGNICKKLGIDVYEVAKGMGMDERISPRFLRAGAGYGGSCFPKDVNAIISKARELGYTPDFLRAVVKLNELQPLNMIRLLRKHVKKLKGKKIGILGLSFKPGTDDVRESPSKMVVSELLNEGAKVKVYDPEAMDNFRREFPEVEYCNPKEVLNSDATLIMTDWEEFESLDYSGKIIIDGRRIEKAKEADIYEGICW